MNKTSTIIDFPDRIERFVGDYAFLSNFYPSPITFEGRQAVTVEHAFQAAKTSSRAERDWVLQAQTAGLAKRRGRQVTLRPEWDEIRYLVMMTLVRRKFNQNWDLCGKLLRTGNARLVEGNSWNDTFWGVCNGVGSNHLGIILMDVRHELRLLEP